MNMHDCVQAIAPLFDDLTSRPRRIAIMRTEMYKQGVWSEDHTRVIMMPLQKKANAVECGDHRTISLISHVSKILLKLLTRRIEGKTRDFIERNQFVFRKGCGTRDVIGVMRMLCERSLELGNEIYIYMYVSWILRKHLIESIGLS